MEIKINQNIKTSIESTLKGLFVNDAPVDYSIKKIDNNYVKIFKDNRIYEIRLLKKSEKEVSLLINGDAYTASITDRIDGILKELGMSTSSQTLVNDIKAPMPGTILNILTKVNQEVKAGDQLIVLEAMKMENVIKSPRNGKVVKILVKEGMSVDKNELLISFE